MRKTTERRINRTNAFYNRPTHTRTRRTNQLSRKYLHYNAACRGTIAHTQKQQQQQQTELGTGTATTINNNNNNTLIEIGAGVSNQNNILRVMRKRSCLKRA